MKMNKIYRLFLYNPNMPNMFNTVDSVNVAIEDNVPVINTIQVITCTTDLFRKGYRIFVHPNPGDCFEITLGTCERTNREIKMGNCLYKIILAGEFC